MEKEKSEVLKMDTLELQRILDEDMKEKNERKHYFVHGFLLVVLVISLIVFIMNIINPNHSIIFILKDLVFTLFVLFFVITSITYRRYHKRIIFISGLFLLGFILLNNIFHDNKVNDISFQKKSVEEVMKWAKENKIMVEQFYEYSDLVPEYKIIYQDYDKKNKKIKIAISEGVNPYKEIMIPSMITWNSKQVLEYVKDNYLNNVIVEYITSDQVVDTVIEQSVTGSIRRNEELKLVFSYGEELNNQEVQLIDFKNMSKFEVELYMKKNNLRYEFLEDYSSKIKKGLVLKQSIDSGTIVKPDDQRIQITISRGKAIKVIDFKDYDIVKITNWAIKNKMKLHFLEKYDDTLVKGSIISVAPKALEIVPQGSSLDVVISKGPLKMPKFKDLNDFYSWSKKNNIAYIEEHEFNDKVKAGEVISYSYKEGETIKNSDAITVKISDGSKKVVPDLKGLNKDEATSKLDDLGLNYNFIYQDSESDKDTVLNQSIAPGSEISTGLTITITLAN